MENLHRRIKELRISKELTQRDMAKHLDVSQTSYQKIEIGQTSLTIDRLKQIANIFEMNFFELLGANGTNSDCSDLEEQLQDVYEHNEHLQEVLAKMQEAVNKDKVLRRDMQNDLILVKNMLREAQQGKSLKESYQIALSKEEPLEEFTGFSGSPDIDDIEDEYEEDDNDWKYALTPYQYFKMRLQMYQRLNSSGSGKTVLLS